MLGKLSLSAVRGPVATVYDNLASEDGAQYLTALNRFNREWRTLLDPKTPGLFDPATFIGKGWKIIGDRKALSKSFDPRKLRVVPTPLKKGESYISGDEAKKRLAGEPLAGVEAFWKCWNDRDNLPVELRGKIILFDGDELRSPLDGRCSLSLSWDGEMWRWGYGWLGNDRDGGFVYALAS